jgi:hypothetical protein
MNVMEWVPIYRMSNSRRCNEADPSLFWYRLQRLEEHHAPHMVKLRTWDWVITGGIELRLKVANRVILSQ